MTFFELADSPRRELADPARASQASDPVPAGRLRVLLVEDDPGDAFLVEELLVEAQAPIDLEIATTMAAARPRLRAVDCVLVDLGLPDATGLQAAATAAGPRHARGGADRPRRRAPGVAAVAEGAQDYLVKGQVDGPLLTRVLRYAVERTRATKRAASCGRHSCWHGRRRGWNAACCPRRARPTSGWSSCRATGPGMHRCCSAATSTTWSQTADGAVHLLIGDVCGHGPDEAALGRVPARGVAHDDARRPSRRRGAPHAGAGAGARAAPRRALRHRRMVSVAPYRRAASCASPGTRRRCCSGRTGPPRAHRAGRAAARHPGRRPWPTAGRARRRLVGAVLHRRDHRGEDRQRRGAPRRRGARRPAQHHAARTPAGAAPSSRRSTRSRTGRATNGEHLMDDVAMLILTRKDVDD